MATVIQWPKALLAHLDSTYFINWKSRSAGVSLIGTEQTIEPAVGIWSASLTLPRQFDGRMMKEFEAYVAMMQGRLNIAEFEICDAFRYGPKVSPAQEPFEDGTWFDDGSGFLAEGTAEMKLTADASVGDTTLYVNLASNRPRFRLGDEFSFNGFLHRVVGSTNAGWVKFYPRLRTNIPTGGTLLTDPPVVRMRFATADQGERVRELKRYGGAITLNFVEAFDR